MPRLFTGLKVPPALATRLTLLQSGLRGVKWVDPEDFHITLRFYGDVENHAAQAITDNLEHLCFAPFTLNLSPLGVFGGKQPHMIWAGIKENPQLTALHKAHEQLAQRLGFKPEGRKFIPHITIARGRSTTTQAVSDYLSSHDLITGMSFEIDEFTLYSAKASTGGGPYITEATFPAS